jgi:hypothetical protein
MNNRNNDNHIVNISVPIKEIKTLLSVIENCDYYSKLGCKWERQKEGFYYYTLNKSAKRLDAFLERLKKAIKEKNE